MLYKRFPFQFHCYILKLLIIISNLSLEKIYKDQKYNPKTNYISELKKALLGDIKPYLTDIKVACGL